MKEKSSKKETYRKDKVGQGKERRGKGCVPVRVSSSKKCVYDALVADQRLSIGGIWRKRVEPSWRVRIVSVGVSTSGVFDGSIVVRFKVVGTELARGMKEEDFLKQYEPVLSVVRKD